MSKSKIPVTSVAILTYAIMAGFFTQSGILLGPAAAYFGRSVTDTAVVFSYLLGGNLVGIVVSLVVFDMLSIRQTLLAAYAVMSAGVAVLYTSHVFALAAAAIALVGFGGGLGLATGAVIISKTYAAGQRAIAFLVTDCAFSIAGIVFPALAGRTIAAGFGWQSGYVTVGVLAVILAIGSGWIRFPVTTRTATAAHHARTPIPKDVALRVGLFGSGLALYLCGQSTFLIWSPNFLHAVFALPPLAAGGVVSNFWGPSIFGLIGAALLVTRVPPRAVLVAASGIAVICLCAIATTDSARTFLAATLAFGFSSTCMYKLMISIGSEQLAPSPPQLVTFLLLTGSVGGTLAPVLSARAVGVFGVHAGPVMALGCYALAFAVIVVALSLEQSARRITSANATVS